MSGRVTNNHRINLKPGDLVNMERKVSPLEVRTIETGKMSETIPYGNGETRDKDLYKGKSLVAHRKVLTGG